MSIYNDQATASTQCVDLFEDLRHHGSTQHNTKVVYQRSGCTSFPFLLQQPTSAWLPFLLLWLILPFLLPWLIFLLFMLPGPHLCYYSCFQDPFFVFIFPIYRTYTFNTLPAPGDSSNIKTVVIIPVQVTWAQPLLANLLASSSSKSGSGSSFLISAHMNLYSEQSEPSDRSTFWAIF